jgi:hydroxyacylglutathione hydrolase
MKLFENLHAFLWTDPTTNNANTYLINGTKKILLDPGHYHLFPVVRENLERLSISPSDIDLVIITHAHPDHMEAIRAFEGTSTLIAFPALEHPFVKTVASRYGGSLGVPDFEPDILLQEGTLQVEDLVFQVYHTPGHSPGSISLYWPEKKALFTGDVVFNQGIGRTDLPGGNGEKLKESIRKLARLDSDYLLPGHGEMLSGSKLVSANFDEIEKAWFPYL